MGKYEMTLNRMPAKRIEDAMPEAAIGKESLDTAHVRIILSDLERAKNEMSEARRKGGFAYKQAKAHYERLLRKERMGKR